MNFKQYLQEATIGKLSVVVKGTKVLTFDGSTIADQIANANGERQNLRRSYRQSGGGTPFLGAGEQEYADGVIAKAAANTTARVWHVRGSWSVNVYFEVGDGDGRKFEVGKTDFEKLIKDGHGKLLKSLVPKKYHNFINDYMEGADVPAWVKGDAVIKKWPEVFKGQQDILELAFKKVTIKKG